MEQFVKDFLSKRSKNPEDLVHSLNQLWILVSENQEHIKYLCQYMGVSSFIDLLHRPELRTASLHIIALGCVDQKFMADFIKQSGVERLVHAINDSWNDHHMNAACIALFRIFRRGIKYPKRHDKILASFIPRVGKFLSETNRMEFQLTVLRLLMVLHTYPLAKDSIARHYGIERLVGLLRSSESELQLCSFRTLINFSDFLNYNIPKTDKVVSGLLIEMSSHRREGFRSFAYLCFIELSLQKDITELLVHSGVLLKMAEHTISSGFLDLKRLLLVSLRHILPRLCQLNAAKVELRSYFQIFERILKSKADAELHVLVIVLLHDFSHFCKPNKFFEEFNIVENLLCIFESCVKNYVSPCVGEIAYNTKSLPLITPSKIKEICSDCGENFGGESDTVHIELKVQHDMGYQKATEKCFLTTDDDDANELYTFRNLLREYSTASIEVKQTSLDIYLLKTLLKRLEKMEKYDAQRCYFGQQIVHVYDVLLDALFSNSLHSPIVQSIFSNLMSDERTFVQLIMNEFIVKLDSHLPTGLRFTDAAQLKNLDECATEHLVDINSFTSCVQLQGCGLFASAPVSLEKYGEPTEKLLMLHAALVLASDKSFIKSTLHENGLQILLQSLSNEDPKTPRIAAVTIGELLKFLTLSGGSPLRKSKNWHPHNESFPCCSCVPQYDKLESSEKDIEGHSVKNPSRCHYSDAIYDVKFQVAGAGVVRANRKQICEHSDYFRSLLKGDFLESKSDTISLSNIMQSTLLFVFHYLHGCRVDSYCNFKFNLSLLQKLDLLINCDLFLLGDLKPVVEDLLYDNLCCVNIPLIYEYSKTYNFPALAKKSLFEALCISYQDDYWSCFEELLSLDPSYCFLNDVEHLLTEILAT